MRLLSHIFSFSLLVLFLFSCQKESNIEIRTEATTIAKIYQPDAAVGKDIVIQSITADDVFFNSDYLAAMSWTNAGNFNTSRVLIEFDFSDIPAETQIDSASLSLFWVSSDNLTGQTGENAFSIYKITESWQESSVTWNNQPTTSNVDIINIPKSKSEEQSYLNIDVTGLVQDMINNPSDNHGFMLKLDEEFPYKLVIFGSSNYSDASKRPKLVVYLIY